MSTVPSTQSNNLAGALSPIVRVFGELPFHCDGALLALAFDARGHLWSVEEPGVLRQWDANNGRLLGWHFLSELETVWAFSPDARLLASASDQLSLWDVATGRLRTALPEPSWVTAVAFGPDPGVLATGHDDGAVRLWNLATARLLSELRYHEQPVSALGFSADGRQLASAAEDKLIAVWDLAAGQVRGLLEGHTDRIPALAWHPDGQRLISAGWDTTARVWDTTTLQPVILLNAHTRQVTALALSRDGSLLACADANNAVHLWDLATYRTLAQLRGHTAEVRCLAFSADGLRLASGGDDQTLRVRRAWEQFGSAPRSAGAAGAPTPARVAVSPDSAHLACVGGEQPLRLFPLASAPALPRPDGAGPQSVVGFSPDGRWLVGGGLDTHLRLWEAATGKLFAVMEGHHHPATALAFSPDGRLAASASSSEQTVWLWDVTSGEPWLLIPDASDGCTVESLAFHPQKRLLAVGGIDWMATGGSDGAVSLWDVDERAEVALFGGGVLSVAFHPSGKQLATATLTPSVCVWDVETRELLLERTGHDDAVTCVAYSGNGRWLASGSDDRSVRLWDADSGECLAMVELGSQIKALTFAAGDAFLFTANGNGSCYQLDVQRLLQHGGG